MVFELSIPLPSPMRIITTLVFIPVVMQAVSQHAHLPRTTDITYIEDRQRLPDMDWQAELRLRPFWRNFVATNGQWSVEFDEWSGLPHRAWGEPIATNGASPESRAFSFLQDGLSQFVLPIDELEYTATAPVRNGAYVHYRQVHQGIPVLFAGAKVRLDAQGRVISFGTDLHRNLAIDLVPDISPEAAVVAATADLQGVTGQVVDALPRILPVPGYRAYSHHLVYEVVVETRSAGHEGRHLCWVDAQDGRLWYRQDLVVDHSHCGGGGVEVQVNATVHTENQLIPATSEPLDALQLDIDGQTWFTDDAGFVSFPGEGPISATFFLQGPNAQIRSNGITPQTTATLQSGANSVSFDQAANVRQRSAFRFVNRIHAHMKSVIPAFTGMDFMLPTNIDLTGGNCNAFYNGSSINFYAQGGGCYSLANFGDVVYHEYGHGINDKFYQSFSSQFVNGAMNEGYADVWALTLTGNPVLAQGYQIDTPNDFIRRYDEEPKVYPVNLIGQVHNDGEIIAGAWWTTLGLLGDDMELVLDLFADAYPGLQATVPNGQEGQAYRDVLLDVLLADDDDGDLTNGTPNALAIVEGFAFHGITLVSNTNLVHEPLPASAADETIVLEAQVNITFPDNLYFGDTRLRYRLNSGSQWTEVVMDHLGGTDYSVAIPAQPAGTVVAYYVGITDSFGQLSAVQPIGAAQPDPNLPHYILVGCELIAMEDMDDVNQLGNWVGGLPGDNATTGIWELTVPMPSFSTVDESIIQPGLPYTPGGELCFVTGNASTPNAGPGENDVDGGKTTLFSDPIDMSDMVEPVLTYHRWYTNNPPGGANPNADWWQVYISNNGQDWVPVEDTRVSDRSWRRHAFRVADHVEPNSTVMLRFVASDSIRPGTNLDGGSLVEAAVDDIQLWDLAPVAGIDERPTNVIVGLYPQPADDVVNILLDGPQAAAVQIEVVDLAGRTVVQRRSPQGGQGSPLRLDVSQLKPGSYILRLRWEGGGADRPLSVMR